MNGMATAPEDTATEPGTEAGLPSCDGCRVRKLKCSRDTPSCSKCQSLGVTCIYDLRKNKPGLKAGAVESLGRRIDALERLVCRSGQLPSASTSFQQTQQGHDDILGTTSLDTLVPLQGSLSSMAQGIDALNKNIAILSQAITSPKTTTSSHILSPASSDSRPLKRQRIGSDKHCQMDISIESETREQEPLGSPFPSLDILSADHMDALLDAYFTKVHPWIPMIHASTFRQQMSKRQSLKTRPLILDAILVGALHLVDTQRWPLSADHIKHEVENTRSRVIIEATDSLSVENLQALIIIAFTDIGNGEPWRAWSIIGSLTRTVEYLHLNSEEEDCQRSISYLSPPPLLAPKTWLEDEERRRVFWNIFVLDRVCSITTGWNVGLTADNVWRRLPMCGTHWNDEVQAQSPFFEIWDKSVAKMSNSLAFLPVHYPGRASEPGISDSMESSAKGSQRAQQMGRPGAVDMSAVGAFAYYIESLESLCRIFTYFLQQKVNFNDPEEVSSWLTRFKELDLRLVHWKMFLPQKWKDPTVPPPETAGFLDPNMSLAHITHNTSMILLHQRIGYPGNSLKKIKLPNFYSAETCQSAAIETANITREYLASALPTMPVSPHFVFCAFVSAKALLVHSRYYGVDLDQRFHVLMTCISQMAHRWQGNKGQSSTSAAKFKSELLELCSQCQEDSDFHPTVLSPTNTNYFKESFSAGGGTARRPGDTHTPFFHSTSNYKLPQQQRDRSTGNTPTSSQPCQSPYYHPHPQTCGPTAGSSMASSSVENHHTPSMSGNVSGWAQPTSFSNVNVCAASENGISSHDGLSSILEALADSSFTDMDRIISFEDNYSPVAVPQIEGQGWAAPTYP